MKQIKLFAISVVLSQALALSANAAIKISCVGDAPPSEAKPSFNFTFDENIGSVIVEDPLTQQVFAGNYQISYGHPGTRTAGYEWIHLEASYQLPDYSKAHTIEADIQGPGYFYMGGITLKGLTGQVLKELSVNCSPIP